MSNIESKIILHKEELNKQFDNLDYSKSKQEFDNLDKENQDFLLKI